MSNSDDLRIKKIRDMFSHYAEAAADHVKEAKVALTALFDTVADMQAAGIEVEINHVGLGAHPLTFDIILEHNSGNRKRSMVPVYGTIQYNKSHTHFFLIETSVDDCDSMNLYVTKHPVSLDATHGAFRLEGNTYTVRTQIPSVLFDFKEKPAGDVKDLLLSYLVYYGAAYHGIRQAYDKNAEISVKLEKPVIIRRLDKPRTP